MYGIETPDKANQALRQVELNMFQQIREHPRDNLDNEDNIFPTSFKDDVLLFIHEHKRLPNKTEMGYIKDVHLSEPAEIENLWGNFETLGELSPVEWKQQYEQEFVMDNGAVIDNGDGYVTGALTIGNEGTTEFKDIDFKTYITTDAASESALGSMKGINKYTLDHPGI